jgi:predicted ATP-grasp superfamily ATP-dependent carboligase
MREELADLILRARFATLPEGVTVEGVCEFRKGELELCSGFPPTVTGKKRF